MMYQAIATIATNKRTHRCESGISKPPKRNQTTRKSLIIKHHKIMNKQRRKDIQMAIDIMNESIASMERAKSIIETAAEEERDAYENLPESIQEGERGYAMEEAADTMDEIVESLDDRISEMTNDAESLEALIEQ